MSRLLHTLRALCVDEDASDLDCVYDDDFMLEYGTTERADSSDTEMVDVAADDDEANTERDEPLDRFVSITKRLPKELQTKVFQMCFSRFYETDLLPYLENDDLLGILKVFYDELLLGDGKLYFGGFNEFDVIRFESDEFQRFEELIFNGMIRVRILKIFDLDQVTNESFMTLVSAAEHIWCANTIALVRIHELCPESLSKITDLSVESLEELIRQENLVEIFESLAISLKDFTLPLTPGDTDSVRTIFDTLKNVDHKLTVHLPVSYPLDGARELSSFDSLVDPYAKIELAHILFTLVCPNFRLDELCDYVEGIGFDKFTDFCLVSFPNFSIRGDLVFVSQLVNLVTIVLSGNFNLTVKNFGNLTRLEKMKELMLENCKLESEWFNTCMPPNIKDITISYGSLVNTKGILKVPTTVKVLTVLSKDSFTLKLDNLDFSQSTLSVLKFRIDDDSTPNALNVSLMSIPPSLQEVNCYKLTTFIVEKDIKLSKKKDLTVFFTTQETHLPKGIHLDRVKANVKVNFRGYKDSLYYPLGKVERIESIGGLPNRLLEY